MICDYTQWISPSPR